MTFRIMQIRNGQHCMVTTAVIGERVAARYVLAIREPGVTQGEGYAWMEAEANKEAR